MSGSNITGSIMQYYTTRNMKLIPLHRTHGKKPMHYKWEKKVYSYVKLQHYARLGHNLGFKLGPSDFVIDVDPKNDGDKSLPKLLELLELDDLADIAPTVITGGHKEGRHHYFRLPHDAPLRLKKNVEQFEGIDFLAQCNGPGEGKQVLIPGSIHPDTGLEYQFDDWSPIDLPREKFPIVPAPLIEALSYRFNKTKEPEDGDPITVQELDEMLKQIPVQEYSSNDDWFPLMVASHRATQSAGLQQFLNWSLQDPQYTGHKSIIQQRWYSLDNAEIPEDGITIRTLYKAVLRHDGNIPETIRARQDFKKAPKKKSYYDRTDSQAKFDKMMEKISSINPSELDKEMLEEMFELIYAMNDSVRAMGILHEIAKVTKRRLGKTYLNREYEKYCRQRKKEAKEDSAIEFVKSNDAAMHIVDYLIEHKFGDGRYLIHAPNQEFYQYTGTHWSQVQPNIIEKYIYEAGQELLQRGDLKFKVSSQITPAEKILRARTATEHDLLRFERKPPSVVNTLSGELWIDQYTGTTTLKKHCPESYLMHCLDTAYDPNAKCPRFDKALERYFSNAKKPLRMIQYLWEFIGYTLQPNKNIACFFLWHGRGDDGKSTLTMILEALLGSHSVLPRAIKEFETNHNNHAMASLPGKLLVLDDDVKKGTILPDSALKKLSEQKSREANPKNGHAYNFISTATVLMCSNHWPIVTDISKGFRRRMHLIEFKRSITEDEKDLNFADYIIRHELAGILNKALKALQTLRKRGRFDPPEECRQGIQRWLGLTNYEIKFINDECVEKGKILLNQLYSAYQDWIYTTGSVKKVGNIARFEESLIQLQYKVQNKIVYGLRLKGEKSDE